MIPMNPQASTSSLFTLRGHDVGVTALVYCYYENVQCLISGDQQGTLILWDMVTFKQINSYAKICPSQVQSLRLVKLKIAEAKRQVLVAQSRNDGLFLFDLTFDDLKQLANFPTYEALFSRGDSLSSKDNTAVLAYPSCINNHLVTVRLLGDEAKTIQSGSAQRFQDDESKTVPLFDIVLREVGETKYVLFVAYEDSTICAFSIDLEDIVHVPVLRSSGLNIRLLRKIDLKFKDFVTSFDVRVVEDTYHLVCGSPTKNVYVVATSTDLESVKDEKIEKIPLKRRGVSSIVASSDYQLAAIACWDASIVIYSMASKSPIATLHHHTKQTQTLILLDAPKTFDPFDIVSQHGGGYRYLLCSASMDGTINLTYIK